jgi:hypothetical protein
MTDNNTNTQTEEMENIDYSSKTTSQEVLEDSEQASINSLIFRYELDIRKEI